MRPRLVETDQGSVAIITALFTVVAFGVAALAVDIGNAFARRRQAQTTVDLAALAGGKGLPDVQCAWSLAYDYLARNKTSSDDDPGWPPSVGVLSNGNVADGEIVVQDGTGATVPYGAAATGTVPARCSNPTAGGPARRVRVVAPPRTVDFSLAPIMGFNEVDVTAGATVELRSLGGRLLPFGVPAGCPTYGFGSIKTTNIAGGPCDISTGNFGYLDLLYGGAHNQLFQTLRFGADHAYAKLDRAATEPAVPPDNPPCPPDLSVHPSGLYHHDERNPTGTPNCVRIQTGNIVSVITDAFIRRNNEPCNGTGRLTRIPVALPAADVRTFDPGGGGAGPCRIEGRRLTRYLNAGVSLAAATAPGASDVISNSIIDSPNFFVVPVLYTNERPPNANNFYRIVEFRGFFLDYDTAACSAGGADPACSPFETTGPRKHDDAGQIEKVSGYLFSLDAIMDGANTGPNVTAYTGVGPSVGVLIKDPLN